MRSRKPGQPGEPGSYEEALRWLNTVLAVSEYMSLAKSWQEKGCSSQAETWQVKNIFILTFLLFPWQHKRLNTTLKFHFGSVYIKFAH